jgi:hypothetical protein
LCLELHTAASHEKCRQRAISTGINAALFFVPWKTFAGTFGAFAGTFLCRQTGYLTQWDQQGSHWVAVTGRQCVQNVRRWDIRFEVEHLAGMRCRIFGRPLTYFSAGNNSTSVVRARAVFWHWWFGTWEYMLPLFWDTF